MVFECIQLKYKKIKNIPTRKFKLYAMLVVWPLTIYRRLEGKYCPHLQLQAFCLPAMSGRVQGPEEEGSVLFKNL